SSNGWASSRARRSVRCASRSAAARSPRRSSSRWSCWAASAASPVCMTHSSDGESGVAVVTPPTATPYAFHQLHQVRGRSVWRALVGAVLTLIVGLGLLPLLWMLVFAVGGALSGMARESLIDQ